MKKITTLLGCELSDILSVGSVDIDEPPLLYDPLISQYYLKIDGNFIKIKQYDLDSGLFLGISILDKLDTSINIEDELFCFSSIYSFLMGRHDSGLYLKKVLAYGDFFEKEDVFYSEGIEFIFSSQQGKNHLLYVDPYDLDGLIINTGKVNENWGGNKSLEKHVTYEL